MGMSQADIGCKNGDKVWWDQDWTQFTGTVVNDQMDFDGRVQVRTDCGKVKMRLYPSQLHIGKCPYLISI